jgi:hypothetical protein
MSLLNKNMMKMTKINTNQFFYWLPYIVFFAITFIYFGFIADYILFYQEKSYLFIFSFDFLKENLHQPGGLLIWLGKFFTTFFYYPFAGGLVVALILTLIVLTVNSIIRFISRKNSTLFPILTGVALFYFQTDYRFMLYNNVGLLIQLGFFLLAIRYLNLLRGWFLLLLIPFIYFATCGFTWIYLLMMILYLVLEKKKIFVVKIAAIWCFSYLLFYLSKEFLFFQTIRTLLTFPFTELNPGTQERIFIPFALFLCALPAISKINIKLPERIKFPESAKLIGLSTFIALVLVLTATLRFEKKTSQYFHVEKLFYQKKFDEIIKYNLVNTPNNSLTIFLNNIALCETDKLNDLLFSFSQNKEGNTLFLKWEMVGEILRRGGYFYYTVGMINEAHRWAFENMVMKGQTPEGLKMLIRTELIYGNYNVASRYISVLKRTLFYKKDAAVFEKFLFDDNAIDADSELGDKRRTRLKTDFFSITDDPYINIERILATDSLNKNAFEYKVAFLLLNKDYKAIENELPSFARYGFTRFPVHVEEAITALEVLRDGAIPNLGNIPMSIETQNRWTQYLTILQKSGNNIKTAEPELRRQFGNTFWYWVFYK